MSLSPAEAALFFEQLNRIANALEEVNEARAAARLQDPAENWCGALKRNGSHFGARCSYDAVRDRLCKTHWREENGGKKVRWPKGARHEPYDAS